MDTDDPNYIVGDAALYLTLALAYDALAAPAQTIDDAGVASPDYTRMQPRLATAWQGAGDTEWVISLRDARSHAGNRLRPDDLAWRFDKSFANEQTLGSWRWGACVGLLGVDPIGDRDVRFRLRARLEHFPNWLLSVTPNVVDAQEISRHVTPEDPWGIAWSNQHVAGFGPYSFVGADANSMRFEPRSDYWMGEPGPDPVELERVTTRAEGIALLSSGRPVVVAGPTPDELHRLVGRKDLVVERTWGGHMSVEVNFKTVPFDDVRVRQALAFAVPYREIIDKGLLGYGRPWRSPVKGMSQWYEPNFWRYDTDVVRAQALLRNAGYGDGLATELYIPDRPDCVRIGEILRSAWRGIGVDVEIRTLDALSPGTNPPLRLRTECGHNVSEPLYDLAHDYAVMDPIVPEPGGLKGVGNWQPLWEKNDTALGLFRAALLENDARRKQSIFMELQQYLVGFSSSIFLAENVQALVCTESVPREFYAPDGRFYQAMQYQNPGTVYLP